MPFTPVKPIDALPIGSVTEVRVGSRRYALCNVGGEIHCVDAVCPHANGPLGRGTLSDSLLVCPWHGWEFDCRTGESPCEPSVKVARYLVAARDGWVYIDVPVAEGAGHIARVAHRGGGEP
jgi:nitrite reductase/ring-hydroxylating ferredoxin subunit